MREQKRDQQQPDGPHVGRPQLKLAGSSTHRLREAMTNGRLPLPQMGGDGKVVEVDETFIGKKQGMPGSSVVMPTNTPL